MGVKNLQRVEDPKCCDICAEYDGRVYSVREASGVLPEHPNCEGTWIMATGEIPTRIPTEFTPATTLAEAEKWINNRQLADSVLYKGVRPWGTRLSKANALRKFNAVIKEIMEMERRFKIKFPKVNKFYITKTARGRANTTLPASEASISFGDAWGKEAWASQAKWDKKWAEIKGKWNWFEKEGSIPNCVRHEYAHILDGQFKITRSPEFRKLFRDLARIDKFTYRDISHYAARKGAVEAWSVAFSHYTSPFYKEIRRYPKRLESFIESILEKLKVGG